MSLTPRQIVGELDKFVIGQNQAKKAVAIALRNRWRRRQIDPEFREEIYPKNIIMIGPTGVGKTEIARRLAGLSDSPFLKVEASKFTEVGYVGRDVESMVRDLTELTITRLKAREAEAVRDKAREIAEERLLDLLLPGRPPQPEPQPQPQPQTLRPGQTIELGHMGGPEPDRTPEQPDTGSNSKTRERLREALRAGKMDERFVDLEVSARAMPKLEIFSNQGVEEMDLNLKDMFGHMFPSQTKRRKVKIPEALEMITNEEAARLVDMDKVVREALAMVAESGIIFLDEIDKVAVKSSGHGPDISREGVQRDLLPIVEGTTVTTKHGPVKTDHILFIASGAFHMAKPSDLIPELQGRFPIRVELDSLGAEEFIRILTEPKSALVTQYQALMAVEGVDLSFSEEAVRAIATTADEINQATENIGARRLHTVMERLLEEISFNASDLEDEERKIVIDADYVNEKLESVREDRDLSRYIL